MSGYEQDTDALRGRLGNLEAQIAGFLNQPADEVSDGHKMIALAIQTIGLRMTIAQRDSRMP